MAATHCTHGRGEHPTAFEVFPVSQPSLAGCCYKKLTRLIPDLVGLVDSPCDHARQSTVQAGLALNLLVLAKGECLQYVDIALSLSSGFASVGTGTNVRVHFLGDGSYAEPLSIPRNSEEKGHTTEAVKEILTRQLLHWLKALLQDGYRLGQQEMTS